MTVAVKKSEVGTIDLPNIGAIVPETALTSDVGWYEIRRI
jgi:hypothetical protein